MPIPPKITGRMTLDQLANDMRARNVSIGKDNIADMIADGTFPIGRVISVGGSGRRNIFVLASDYYPWAEQRLGPYVKGV